jgi:hypothetical protein
MSLASTRFIGLLAAFLMPAAAQLTPTPLLTFPPALQTYLELTRDQVTAIQRLNSASSQFQLEKMQRSAQVQVEIAQETAKPTLDSMALGLRYVELEAIRRELAADQEKTYNEIQKLLTDPQKTKVQALTAAMRMQGLICDAQSQNILPGAGGIPNIIPGGPVPVTRIPNPFYVSGVSTSFLIPGSIIGGCSARWFDPRVLATADSAPHQP